MDSRDPDPSAPAELLLIEDIEAVTQLDSGAPEMSLDSGAPISRASTGQFVAHFLRGARPPARWKNGLEFELFGYASRTLDRLDPGQVQAVLMSLAPTTTDLVLERGILVETSLGNTSDRLTVEPGGQIEFSGTPRRRLAEIESDLRAYLEKLREVAGRDGFVFLATGFDPLRTIEEQHWFPKRRYEVMRPYLARRGSRAWDMMCRTCALQVSLDYESEADLARKFILGNRLAPVITAIFANSPFEHGAPSGYKSTRAAAWLETDADRSSISPPAFDEGFSLEAFVDYLLTVPMIFARRNGDYLPRPAGLQFSRFLDGSQLELEPVFEDWTDHLTTIFTEARLKQYIELRSADCGNLEMALALNALWKGLMYDAESLDAALRLAPGMSRQEAHVLQREVARHGLAAHDASIDVLSIAKDVVALAAAGLGRIAPTEVKYLDPLFAQVVEEEICPADILLRNWHGSWHGSTARLVEYLRIA